VFLLSAVCLALSAAGASPASANLEFSHVGVSIRDAIPYHFSPRAQGPLSRQAGAHPDFAFEFNLPGVKAKRDGLEVPTLTMAEAFRDVELELPPGMFSNPSPFPTCTTAELAVLPLQLPFCSASSQVGVIETGSPNAPSGGTSEVEFQIGVYNLAHGPEVPARFGFNYLGYVATITPTLRPGAYGDPDRYSISAGSTEIGQGKVVGNVRLILWGSPTESSHDLERQLPGTPFVGVETAASTAPKVPFFTNPTACPPSPQVFTARGDSWENPGVFDEISFSNDEEGTPFLWTGCEKVPFEPQARLSPDSRAAHSPTGLGVHIDLPQNESPSGLATSAVKKVALTLPQGVAISPSVASGQSGCTLAQVSLATNDAPTCPDSSKIGTVAVKSPLLAESLQGSMVLAAQKENPFNSTYAVYMLVKGPGFWLKFPGQLQADPQTGQLRTVFDELPQLPVETVDVQLEGGPAAPLSTPSSCGTYSAAMEITPWARPTEPVVQDIPMKFDQNCSGGGFNPGLKGGTVNPSAGKRSPFVLQISHQDGEQNVSRIDVTLPKGQLASLKGVTECPEAQAGTGLCPSSSQIGVAKAAVGVGTEPLQVPQPGKAPTALFLGGPYKGAPLSLIALVPAQAGPFDLGNVVVRTALEVDPTTAQVTAKSDPLPQIIEGVPLSYREVRIELTRPDFAVNPTSCEPTQIISTLTSAGGAQAHPSVPYQVVGCASLGFKPSLKLAMRGSLKRAGNPALSATLNAPEGQANVASTTVILPKTVFIDQRHVTGPCTRVQFAADACPASSVLGTATAWSPLLDQPLSGLVYFRSNGGERQLPDIVADLNGQIHVVLVGFIDSKKVGKESSLVRTRFASVPDAPVSKFEIRLKGGKRSLIQNSANLCKVHPKAEVKMTGQNGKTNDFEQPIQISCGKKSKGKKAAKH